MRNQSRFRLACLLLVLASVSMSGCKIKVKVPTGGRIVSADGSFVCEARQTCVIDVVDIYFNQTFIAEPAHGYYFRNWRTRDGSLCSGESGPCQLSTEAFEGNPELQLFLESDETFMLEPLFVYTIDCPPPEEPELVVSPAVGS